MSPPEKTTTARRTSDKNPAGPTQGSDKSCYEQEMPDDAVQRAMVEFANDLDKKSTFLFLDYKILTFLEIPGLIAEFEKIENIVSHAPSDAFDANPQKNRHTNFPCYDFR